MAKWYQHCYARLQVDNHITEHDPSFMIKFDPARYASLAEKAGVDSAMVCACCHNGNCYYPTRVGHMHKNLDGRDVFGETVRLLKAKGIVPIAYYSVTHHNHAARTHPPWRVVLPNGEHHVGRFWFCCPNNPDYVEFSKEHIAEILAYEVEGIFIDMTFWPGVCLCDICQRRFRDDTRNPIPSVIDWNDKDWVRFQRWREDCISRFAHDLTAHAKRLRPGITVAHQFAQVLCGWYFANNPGIADAGDYASADFYGGTHQERFAAKILAAFSKNAPFEFLTSCCTGLGDHTSMKSAPEMVCSAATALAAGGAHLFVDAINPDGTLLDAPYQHLATVGSDLQPFKDILVALKPQLVADVGLYFSTASQIDERHNGLALRDVFPGSPVLDPYADTPGIAEPLGTSIILSRAHIPYRIITSDTPSLAEFRTIIINNAIVLSDDLVTELRAFVTKGGVLIATGMTSYYNLAGETSGDFALADVFGVSYAGRKSARVTYLTLSQDELISCDQAAPLVRATSARSLAKVAQPLFPPDDDIRYASIHSNPPGPPTEYDGLTLNRFGKGLCVYLYSPLMAAPHHAQQAFAQDLLRKYLASDLDVTCTAPSCVELTVLKATTPNCYLLCFVNYQHELPNIPVYHLKITVRVPDGFVPTSCRTVSNGETMQYHVEGGRLTVELPSLNTIEMIEVR